VDGADHPLLAAVVAEHAPRRLDAGRERRLGYETGTPHLLEQLLLRDEPIAVGHQVADDLEDLRLDVDRSTVAPELEGLEVELDISEPDHHRRQP
jgi:hypothetical protein